jgi:hypothetical protein
VIAGPIQSSAIMAAGCAQPLSSSVVLSAPIWDGRWVALRHFPGARCFRVLARNVSGGAFDLGAAALSVAISKRRIP